MSSLNFRYERHRGLYQKKVTSSLTSSPRPGQYTHNNVNWTIVFISATLLASLLFPSVQFDLGVGGLHKNQSWPVAVSSLDLAVDKQQHYCFLFPQVTGEQLSAMYEQFIADYPGKYFLFPIKTTSKTLFCGLFIFLLLFPCLFIAVFTAAVLFLTQKENGSSKDSHEKTRK